MIISKNMLGLRQSPINIMTEFVEKETDTEITIEGTDIRGVNIRSIGHSIIVNYIGATVVYKSREETSNWTLLQFHYHAPSEHRINNETFDLEMHSVFTKDTDISQLLVVGVIYKEDPNTGDDAFLSALGVENLPATATAAVPAAAPIADAPLMEFYKKFSTKAKYNYKGSLTAPACAESVEWFVVEEIQKINSVQLERFTGRWAGTNAFAGGRGNNRLAMDLNRRQVFLTRSKDDGSKV